MFYFMQHYAGLQYEEQNTLQHFAVKSKKQNHVNEKFYFKKVWEI